MATKRGHLVRLFSLAVLLGVLVLSGCSFQDFPALLSGCTFWNQAPGVPMLSGPTTGDPGSAYDFSAVATDPEGKTISYELNWDDGTTFGTTGFVASGTAATLSHTYAAAGTYHIVARAIDSDGATSGWSAEHTIAIGGGGGDGGGDEEGEILWQVEVKGLGVEPLASSHPAIASDGTIYVTAMGTTGTWTSRLVALRPDGT